MVKNQAVISHRLVCCSVPFAPPCQFPVEMNGLNTDAT